MTSMLIGIMFAVCHPTTVKTAVPFFGQNSELVSLFLVATNSPTGTGFAEGAPRRLDPC